MEHSQLPEDIILQVKEHAHREFPREACGVLVIIRGRRRYVPCTNISDNENEFIIDHREYVKISLSGDIEYIVHSHIKGALPSSHDISACAAINIPYLIYYMEFDTYGIIPIANTVKLLGLNYEFGKQDCFEAGRNWFNYHGIIMPPRKNWLDNWWDQGYNYMETEVLNWPLVKVNNLMYGDVLTLNVESNEPNHIAIYLDNDMIYHHAVRRLSCRENMYPFWASNINGIYRYEKACNPAGIPRREIRA